MNGVWRRGPGLELFTALTAQLGQVRCGREAEGAGQMLPGSGGSTREEQSEAGLACWLNVLFCAVALCASCTAQHP